MILEHYGAANGGLAAAVSSAIPAASDEVCGFVEWKTGQTGWLIESGFPKKNAEKGFVWVLTKG